MLNIKGLGVTNNFGERFWIEAAGRGADESWQRWNLFSLNIKGQTDEPADLTLLMLPTVPKSAGGLAARGDRAVARRDGEHGVGHRNGRCRMPSGGTVKAMSPRRAARLSPGASSIGAATPPAPDRMAGRRSATTS